MNDKDSRQHDCDAASKRNEIESSELYSEWKMIETDMYKSNSNKQKHRIVRTVPVNTRETSYGRNILASILLDILFPTIRRVVQSAFLG